jgi:WD40 repeat protein
LVHLHWKHKLQLCYAIISVLIEYCAQCAVVRTFTGHRSNCASLDFHPFGEFLASGSSDTNMKIWDIRKKRCIHTYKGHTRRIDVLKFTPDGRWIVSGGADNSVKVKLWACTLNINT